MVGSWYVDRGLSSDCHRDAGRGSKKRTVLYWRHPEKDTEFAAEPKKTEDGRDYVAVYDDQEADFAEAKPKEPPKGVGGAPKKIL